MLSPLEQPAASWSEWLAPARRWSPAPAVILSVAHLDEDELSLAWLAGLATQPPMDRDYRALSKRRRLVRRRLATDRAPRCAG
jgi:hypothetical protein